MVRRSGAPPAGRSARGDDRERKGRGPWTAPDRRGWGAGLLGGRLLTLAAGAAAALPIVASTVRAVHAGWQPTDDKGIIATRAYDVFTGHTPLVGQYSMASLATGHVTHAIGPMLYWLLAVPVRIGTPSVMAVTMGAMNAVAILATVGIARRRGGRPLMFATAVAIAVMTMSLAAETFHDIWNPAAPLFPFLLLIFLCWSLACGEYRWLPLIVVVGSFVSQAHLSYLPPAAGMVAVGLAGLVTTRIAGRGGGSAVPAGTARRRAPAAWGVAAVLTLAVCWLPAAIDQATARPGNLSAVVEYSTTPKPTLGPRVGAHAVVRAVGVVPWWLIDPTTRWDRKLDLATRPGTGRIVSAIALLATLCGVAIAGAVRRRIDLVAAALIGLALCGSLAAVAAQTPAAPSLAATVGYTLWWGSHCGMWVWLILAWSLWLLGAAGLRALARRGSPAGRRLGPALRRGRVPAVAAVAGLAVCVVAGAEAAGAGQVDQHVALYAPLRAIDARLAQAIAPGRTVRYDGSLDPATLPFKPAIRFFMARRGVRVLSRGAFQRNGDWYELHRRPYDTLVAVSDRPRPPRRGLRLLIRVGFREAGAAHSVFVWMSRGHRVRRA